MLLCTLRLASQNYASQSFAPAGAKKFKILSSMETGFAGFHA